MENAVPFRPTETLNTIWLENHCSDLSAACHTSCLAAIQHCLSQGSEPATAEQLSILRSCADICLANTQFLLTRSYFYPRVAAICADVCDTCAIECQSPPGDPALLECAEKARLCADTCRRIAAQVAA